ncbi:hypothetical protein SAMN05216184_108146 [Georgenia satyanarayanai]|uniref:Lipoprotein n=1 Tax=Georgenia satyanarayanai TaxID=860221 RepID=A0A2Y9BYY3_9MICO|nr:hypothetical protein [Georgenia satyanarayanai]PYF99264.1 hypothetical protein A8987_108146 [Georgenia satyanarayanai]SSA43382.1 hypothetical protein SAMN05216184_108146 [Georgenia satyanarayanai]
MTTARAAAGALVLLGLVGCSTDATTTEPEDIASEIAPSTGPYDVGDTIPAGEVAPHEARREAAERLARENDREYVWVTDAYTIAEGGEVVEAYYSVDGTGEASDRVRDEWMTFDDPGEALDYANEVVADVSEPERYDVVPLEP